MSTIREVLARIEETKKQRKILKETINQALAGNAPWVRIKEEVTEDKARLERAKEAVLYPHYQGEMQELERLDLEIKNDTEVLSDIALNMFMKGENIEIENNGKTYRPKVSVLFQQMKLL